MSQNQDIALHINSEQSKDFGERNMSIIRPKEELASFSRQNTSDFVHTEDILNFTPMNIFQLPKLQYLQNLKNPCVFVKTKEAKRKLVCFPYFILAGFPKCGTSDLYNRLSKHPHFVKTSVKEPHFWDNLFPLVFQTLPNQKLAVYSKYMQNLTKTIENTCMSRQGSPLPTQCPYISGDFTTWTAFDGHQWQQEFQNANLDEPKVLIPHKLFHLNPSLRIIFILRNPVDAVFSNYRYNMRKYGNQTDFHKKVEEAIKWWGKCTSLLSERRCAYGLAYPEPIGTLNPLGPHRGSDAVFPRDLFWKYTSIDRLRIYIYHIYIRDWLSVFPAKNVLCIKFENFTRNPLKIMTQKVLPFLSLTELENKTLNTIRDLEIDNRGIKHFEMLRETRILLQDFFKPHLEKLGNLLKTNSYKWF